MAREAALKAEGARVAIDTPLLDGSIALKGAQVRRSAPEEISRDHQPQKPGDRAAGAQEHRLSLLRRIRLDGRLPTCRRTRACGSSKARRAFARPSGDADLGQWQWPRLHPRHLGRRPIHVQRRRQRDQQFRHAQTLVSLRLCGARRRSQGADQLGLHQGFVGVANGSETDANYSDFKDQARRRKTFSSTGGWVGITDKYWMAAIIPPQNGFRRLLSGHPSATTKAYQANYRLPAT